MTYQYLEINNESNIAIVSFNRPERRNALNYDFLEEIEHCALSFREQAEVYAVIFRGEGAHFSAGADLTEMENYPEMPLVQKRRRWRIGERAIRAIRQIDQITFAAWNGGALGGGACLVSALDFRVGDKNCFLHRLLALLSYQYSIFPAVYVLSSHSSSQHSSYSSWVFHR